MLPLIQVKKSLGFFSSETVSIVRKKLRVKKWGARDRTHGNWRIILSFRRGRRLLWWFWMAGVRRNLISTIASTLPILLPWIPSKILPLRNGD
ncbi:hypothetical protein OIU78_001671 [Salix suchowensis]|nr:hypothetical protein OIU78_001671 [Salix suchowensis]